VLVVAIGVKWTMVLTNEWLLDGATTIDEKVHPYVIEK
jgi:hypothetical protein